MYKRQILNLKDLLPSELVGPESQDLTLDSTFRATRLEFIILARDNDDVLLHPDKDDDEIEWGIPEQELFDEVVARGVQIFTKDSPDLILNLAWSSTGWETGVGLVALTTDNLQTVDDFRYATHPLNLPFTNCLLYTSPSPRD